MFNRLESETRQLIVIGTVIAFLLTLVGLINTGVIG